MKKLIRCATTICALLLFALYMQSAFGISRDTDKDGIPDNLDNCVLTANPQQVDVDNDGWGNRCDADYNNDGAVNFTDFSLLSSAFLEISAELDLNGDAFINLEDISIFSSLFNQVPGPAGSAIWIQAAGGNWEDPENWFPRAVPSARSHVVIDVPGEIMVQFTGSLGTQEISSLTSSEALIIFSESSASLRVNGNAFSAGTLVLRSGIFDVSGLLIVDGFLQFDGGILANATVTTTAPPLVTSVQAVSQVDNIVLQSDLEVVDGSILAVRNGLQLNNANIRLKCDESFAEMTLLDELTVTGNGSIDFIGYSDQNDACRISSLSTSGLVSIDNGITIRTVFSNGQVSSSDHELHIAAVIESHVAGKTIELLGDTLTISGNVSAENGGAIVIDGQWQSEPNSSITADDGYLYLAGNWIHQGVITATDSYLELGDYLSQSWKNLGNIVLENSPASLRGIFKVEDMGNFNSDSLIVIEGLLDNTDKILNLDGINVGELTLGDFGTIKGGTIASEFGLRVGPSVVNATLDGVVLNTDLFIENFAQVTVHNNLTLVNSSVRLHCDSFESRLQFEGNQSLLGTGQIIFDGTNLLDTACEINVSKSDTLNIDYGIVIKSGNSGGSIGDYGNGKFIINGAIESSLPQRTIRIISNGMQIAGEISATNGGNLLIDGVWSNEANAKIGVLDGSIELFGEWINFGQIKSFNASVILGDNNGSWSNKGSINLTASPADLNGRFTTADLLSLNSDSTVSALGTLDNTNSIFDLDELNIAELQFGQHPFFGSGRIDGGVIKGSSPLIAQSNKWLTLANVTLETDLLLDINSDVFIEHNLTLVSSNIIMRCSFDLTGLRGSGDSLITGVGQIRMEQSSSISSTNSCQLTPSTGNDKLTIDTGVNLQTFGDLTFVRIAALEGETNILGDVTIGGTIDSFTFIGRPQTQEGKINILGDINVTGTVNNFYFHSYPLTIGGAISSKVGNVMNLKFDGNWTLTEPAALRINATSAEFYGNWINFGTIEGNIDVVQFGQPFVNPNTQSWNNQGQIFLHGSLVELFGTFHTADLGHHFFDQSVVMRGLINNVNRTIDLDNLNGNFSLGSDAVLIGGNVSGSVPLPVTVQNGADPIVENVTFATDLFVSSDIIHKRVSLSGVINLVDANILLYCPSFFTIPVISKLTIVNPVNITGNGSIIIDGDGPDSICEIQQQDGLSSFTIGGDVSILIANSNAMLGNVQQPLDMTINGTLATDLFGRTASVYASQLTNHGTLTAVSGALDIVTEDFDNNGNVTANASAVVQINANSSSFSSATNTNITIGESSNGLISFSNSEIQLAGNVNFLLDKSFSPIECNSFVFMTYPSFSGDFDSITGPDFGNGQTFSIDLLDTEAIAVVPGTGC